MQPQKMAIALSMDEKLLVPIREWGKRFDFSHVESVLFIHIAKRNITPLEFGLVETPDEEAYQDIKPELEKFLTNAAKKILPTDYQGKVSFKLERDFQPSEEIINILKEEKITLVVAATHGRHGIQGVLHSSFTEHLVKHSPCDVLVIRPAENIRQAA